MLKNEAYLHSVEDEVVATGTSSQVLNAPFGIVEISSGSNPNRLPLAEFLEDFISSVWGWFRDRSGRGLLLGMSKDVLSFLRQLL